MIQMRLSRVDAGAASDWARGSLAQGSELATLLTRRLPELSEAFVIGTDRTGPQTFDDTGRGFRSADVDAVVQRVFESLSRAGAGTLIVEDDLARRGDLSLSADVTFVEDRVLRWIALGSRAVEASRLLRAGSSGYPLNAMLCRPHPGDLPLEAGRVLGGPEAGFLADVACALITAVYDAESYLILAMPDLELSSRAV